MTRKSPLAPECFPDLPDVAGVRLSVGATGIRYQGRDDLLLAVLAPGTSVAGLFTRSSMPSAPVVWCRSVFAKAGPGATARALVVNAGNANAFTGEAGFRAAEAVARCAANLAGCDVNEVFLASTGVIGEPPRFDPIIEHLPELFDRLESGGWQAATKAIHTTDTFPKGACRNASIDGHPVVIAGIAKGSGMIHPNMATTLAFIFTDAAIPSPVLRTLLREANEASFHSITVDGDTSTSDTVLAFATGRQDRHRPIDDAADPRLDDFRGALNEVMTDIARQIVRDGEGASKFITVIVTGAQSDRAAKTVAFAIANSPLVKTAIAGEDPNWGRIVMAVGKAGEQASPDRLTIRIGGQAVTAAGCIRADYDEAVAAKHLKGAEIDLGVDLGEGEGQARVWTCDFTHDYVAINADYRS
ncbi:MAG: bifunctional glutamate N-acetyltransferase/amino-acid acetyltransferase ArgJ [Sphingomonadales bacterium]